MATAVFFHAHPDDEAIITGGTMVLASRAGHRVVAVCATDGSRGARHGLDEHDDPAGGGPDTAGDDDPAGDDDSDGGSPDSDGGGDSDGGDLAAVREAELRTAAEILGVHRVEMLGYADSGMAGDAANDDPACFWQADVAEAAERLAAILREESADILTCYDHNGGYGHPDHIQVHRVGVKAAELAGVGVVYESTLDRQHFQAALRQVSQIAADAGVDMGSDEEQAETAAELESESFGSDAADITHRIDVSDALDEKRRAMLAHGSQIPADSFFVSLPDEAFALMSATEWFILRGADRRDPPADDIFTALRR